MGVLEESNISDNWFGGRNPGKALWAIVLTIPLIGSAHYYLFLDKGFFWWLLSMVMIFSIYTGWAGVGVVISMVSMFSIVYWRFAFPPLLGYIRDSTKPVYAPPRMLGYEQPPIAELREGMINGFGYALLISVVVAPLAYWIGTRIKRVG